MHNCMLPLEQLRAHETAPEKIDFEKPKAQANEVWSDRINRRREELEWHGRKVEDSRIGNRHTVRKVIADDHDSGRTREEGQEKSKPTPKSRQQRRLALSSRGHADRTPFGKCLDQGAVVRSAP